MVSFPGRVEAKIVVPTGGAAVSASTGALTSAVTVTVPAGSYFHTAAGGVDSLIDELESQLNDNVQPYPQSAAALVSAIGDGTWGIGWLMNESSGSLGPAFGATSLSAVSTPTYGTAGPCGGIDVAIGFNSSADAFSAGDNFDADATDDTILAWVGKCSTSTGNGDLMGKGWGGLPAYALLREGTDLNFYIRDAGANLASAGVTVPLNVWHVGIAVIDRTRQKIRVGVCQLGGSPTISSEASTTAVGSAQNALNFTVGDTGGYGADTGTVIAALYLGDGSGVAGGLSAGISAALTNFANCIGSSWSVSMSTTTGQITCSHSFWPSYIAWTSTALRDVLGYGYNFDYPGSAAQLATAVGYGGTWSAAYLCNESSGSLASAFGTPATLSAVSSPTYSAVGARGGADTAVGFNSADDGFDGGDYHDVTSTDDLLIAWVAYKATASAADVLGKINGALTGWGVFAQSTTGYRFYVGDGATDEYADSTGQMAGEWHVGIAYIDRGAAKIGIAVKGLRSGTTSVASSTIGTIGSLGNAIGFRLGDLDVNGASGSPSLSYVAVGVGAGVASGMDMNAASAIANFATYMKSQTGTEQAEGLFLPDCPINLEGDPTQAPRVSDLRTTRGPTGTVLGLSGNSFYRHRNIVWSAVPRAQVWESAATYSNSSWETFFSTTQMGFGHSWFSPASPVQIYWSEAGTQVALGYEYNDGAGVSGWYITNVDSIEPRKTSGDWTGLFRIELPELISSG